MVKKDDRRKRGKRQTSQPDLLNMPAGLESPDPIDGNPFPADDPRHSVWNDATGRAEQEVHLFNASYVKLGRDPRPASPEDTRHLVLDRYAYLVTEKFDIWAKRGIQVVWSDAAVKAFDQWLANYANSWLVSMKGHLLPGTEADWVIDELRLVLIGRIEFWKSEARRYLAEQRAHTNETDTQAPILEDQSAAASPVAGESKAEQPPTVMPPSAAIETADDSLAKGRKAEVEVFVARGRAEGYRITRADIRLVAGHIKDRRSLEHFQYNITQASSSAIQHYERVLKMSVADFIKLREELRRHHRQSRPKKSK